MKAWFVLGVLLTSLFAGTHSARAGSSVKLKEVVLTGTVYETAPTTTSPVAKIPLTKKTLLELLGDLNVNPGDTAFYFINTGYGEIVLASPDGNTTYGVLFAFGSDISVLYGKDGYQSVISSTASLISGAISGEVLGTESYSPTTGITKNSDAFTGHGTINSKVVMIKGSIKYQTP